jgi:capsular exopolysaccharide synthesis family protein
VNSKLHSVTANSGPVQLPDATQKPPASLFLGDALSDGIVETVTALLTPESRIVVKSAPSSLAADRFRLLRMSLNAHWMAGKLKTLLVSSALPGEGKTTTSINLATTLAEHGKRSVVLVETDFRQPVIFERLGLTPWPGLVHALRDDTDPFAEIRKVDPLDIFVLPAGEPAENPLELLNSAQFTKMLIRLRSSVDWVILDCAPAIPVPDVQTIKSKVDGCLWVLRAGQTPREFVEESVQLVGQENIVGMLLNDAESLEKSYYRYGAYGYGYGKGQHK